MPTGAKAWEYDTGDEIKEIALSKDGMLTCIATASGKIIFLDNSGEVLWSHNLEQPINKMAMSKNGTNIGVITADRILHLYTRKGERVWRVSLKEPIWCISMNASGSSIVIGSQNHSAYAIDKSGKTLWGYKMGGPVRASAISGNGYYIAVGSDDYGVYFLDIGGRLLWVYKTQGPIESVEISDNGEYILASSDDRRLYFFDRRGAIIWSPRNRDSSKCLTMDASAKRIAVSVDNEVHFLRREGTLSKRWIGDGEIISLAMSNNGEYVIMGSSDDYAYFFDKNGDVLWKYKMGDKVCSVAISSTGDLCVAGSADGKLCYFNNHKFFENIIAQSRETVNAVKEFGAFVIEAEVLMRRAESELTRKEYAFAMNYARGAERVALRVKEKCRPEISIVAVTNQSFNVDRYTPVNSIIMNTGSANASDITLEFNGHAEVRGEMKYSTLKVNKFVNTSFNIRPLSVGTIPIKLTVTFWDYDGKEYVADTIINIIGVEAGKIVKYPKFQPVIQMGNVQKLMTKVAAAKRKEGKKVPPAPPRIKCPSCGGSVRADSKICPLCHDILKK